MADSRLLRVPELVFENIYRKCDLSTQKEIWRAYRSEESSGLNRVMLHKMEVSCWVCLANVFDDFFGENGGNKIRRTGRFRKEPSLNSRGFHILFKSQISDSDYEYFVQRDLKNFKDMEGADMIYYEFQAALGRVYKARELTALRDHLDTVHRSDKYMPKSIFQPIRSEISKFSNIHFFIISHIRFF